MRLSISASVAGVGGVIPVDQAFRERRPAEFQIGQVAVLQMLRHRVVERQLGRYHPEVRLCVATWNIIQVYSYSTAPGGSASSKTPMWRQDAMSGSRTPAYADGGRTVNPYSDGNRTAYGGTSGSGGVRRLIISFTLQIF